MAGTVQAASLLASGPVYYGPDQNRVACQVFNAGDTPITFISTEIFDQKSLGSIKLDFNNCGESLNPGDICTFQGAAGDEAYACKVRIKERKTNVRGTMTALEDGYQGSEADLR
jgi:hypothetical protein